VLSDSGRAMVKSFLYNNNSFPFRSAINHLFSGVRGI
jgi:hypothetical protein